MGISKQALLYHYPTKAELQHAVFGQSQEVWIAVLPLLLAAVTGGPRETEATLDELMSVADSATHSARFILRVLLGDDREAFDALASGAAVWMEPAVSGLQRGVDNGDFSPDVDAAAWLIETSLHLLTTMALGDITTRGGLLLGAATDIDETTWRKRRLREALRMAKLGLQK